MTTKTASDAAKALRAIKSEKRSETSRANGKKGGRPKQVTVYAYRSNETHQDCIHTFTRKAWYDIGILASGKATATVTTNDASFSSARPITLKIKASESCKNHYSMRDFCDLAESVIETNHDK